MTLIESLTDEFLRLQRQLIPLAELMPAEHYGFRPHPAVRTFGEQLRHIGAVQWVVGSALLDEPPPVEVGDGDSGPLDMVAKPDIIRYARDSFAQIKRAVAATTPENLLELVPHPYDAQNRSFTRLAVIADYGSHGWEHYGQMVVYLRINGMAPPM